MSSSDSRTGSSSSSASNYSKTASSYTTSKNYDSQSYTKDYSQSSSNASGSYTATTTSSTTTGSSSCGTGTSKKCKKVQVGHDYEQFGCSKRGKKGLNKTYKVVQMTGVPPQRGGIIGYVYTYEVRQKHRIVKKNVQPYQPYKVIVVKEETKRTSMAANPDLKIQEANDEIKYADQQIAKALYEKKLAQLKKENAEEWRFKTEELRLANANPNANVNEDSQWYSSSLSSQYGQYSGVSSQYGQNNSGQKRPEKTVIPEKRLVPYKILCENPPRC